MRRILIAAILTVGLCISCVACKATQRRNLDVSPEKDHFTYIPERMLEYASPEGLDDVVTLFHEQTQHIKLEWHTTTPYVVVSAWLSTHLKYIPDKDDYWKTPAQTWNQGGGDCEDLAILYGVLIKKLGCPAVVLLSLGTVYAGGLHLWVTVVNPFFHYLEIDSFPYRVHSHDIFGHQTRLPLAYVVWRTVQLP